MTIHSNTITIHFNLCRHSLNHDQTLPISNVTPFPPEGPPHSSPNNPGTCLTPCLYVLAVFTLLIYIIDLTRVPLAFQAVQPCVVCHVLLSKPGQTSTWLTAHCCHGYTAAMLETYIGQNTSLVLVHHHLLVVTMTTRTSASCSGRLYYLLGLQI